MKDKQQTELGKYLFMARVRQGLTLNRLSQMSGLSRYAVWSAESWFVLPLPENLAKITKALGITEDREILKMAREVHKERNKKRFMGLWRDYRKDYEGAKNGGGCR